MTDASDDSERIRAMVVDHPMRRAAAAEPQILSVIDPAAWDGAPIPLRVWALRELILCNSATYLTGPGSAGKSLAGQQAATCVALGLPFLSVETRQATALYLTCEDDADELHRRQEAICEALEVPLRALSGRLHLVSLVGELGNELCTFDASGRMETPPAWDRLRATVLSLSVGFIVLDNVAHLFAGNENDRHQVAGFCGLMNALAAEARAAVLFIGHPNKAGDSFSGSTAWENQVRSRLFLDRPKGDDGEVLDPDARVLRREKANYARTGEAIAFRWYRGAFVRPEDQPAFAGVAEDATQRLRAEEERFLACLQKATSERRAVSHQNGINWAPRRFAAMPEARGMSERALAGAMERLFSVGAILADQALWKGSDRHWKRGIGCLGEVREPCGDPLCGDPCGNPLREPCGNPLRAKRQTFAQPAGTPAATLRAGTPSP